MVREEVWSAVGGDDYLCVGCLERRLGRELCAEDFAELEVNQPSLADTPRLALRKSLHLWHPRAHELPGGATGQKRPA